MKDFENRPTGARPGRVLLLTTPHTYRTRAFTAAAGRLGIETIEAIDTPAVLARRWSETMFGVDFSDPDEATTEIIAFAAERPFDAILAVDDSGSLLAARVSQVLGLPHNDPQAAEAARNKYHMRQLLSRADVPSPAFQRFFLGDDGDTIAAAVSFPAVIKPAELSGSRGVMRVDDPAQLKVALARLKQMLVTRYGGTDETPYLVEQYIPGKEIALEGLLDNGFQYNIGYGDDSKIAQELLRLKPASPVFGG